MRTQRGLLDRVLNDDGKQLLAQAPCIFTPSSTPTKMVLELLGTEIGNGYILGSLKINYTAITPS